MLEEALAGILTTGPDMTILFLHGWHSVPGGVKPTYLMEHGHAVIKRAPTTVAVRITKEMVEGVGSGEVLLGGA